MARRQKNLKDELKELGVEIVDISGLKPHESINHGDLSGLKEVLVNEGGVLRLPIICDRKKKIIIDGHNRYAIFKELKFQKAPVFYINYFDKRIALRFWGKNRKIGKKDVIKMAESGKLFPPKTTEHLFLSKKGARHISKIAPELNLSINQLKKLLC